MCVISIAFFVLVRCHKMQCKVHLFTLKFDPTNVASRKCAKMTDDEKSNLESISF